MNADTNGSKKHSYSTEQRSDREHTGLRTHEPHYSAAEVYHALECPYPGTEVLRAKERLQARASTDRARAGSRDRGKAGAAAQDRRGESGVSL